jgi:hypothetical protein
MRHLAGSLLVAPLVAVVIVACGSSPDRPPPAEVGREAGAAQDAASADATSDASRARAPAGTCRDPDAGTPVFPGDPSGECHCDYHYSPGLMITLPCGVTLCSVGKNEAAICGPDGVLQIEPGCPSGVDVPSLPPCDGGVPDADADADGD